VAKVGFPELFPEDKIVTLDPYARFLYCLLHFFYLPRAPTPVVLTDTFEIRDDLLAFFTNDLNFDYINFAMVVLLYRFPDLISLAEIVDVLLRLPSARAHLFLSSLLHNAADKAESIVKTLLEVEAPYVRDLLASFAKLRLSYAPQLRALLTQKNRFHDLQVHTLFISIH